MAHIPYASEEGEDRADIVAATRARRGGALLNLDRMLLHFPAVAQGWGALIGPIRKGARIGAFHRELAICAVSRLTRSEYEFQQHGYLLADAGASPAQVAALMDVEAAAADEALFDAPSRAVLRLALEVTRDVEPAPPTLDAVRACFPAPEEVFELVMIIAAYNMVSRVLVGLGVDAEA